MTDLTRIDDGPVATVYSGHRAGAPVAVKVFPKRFDKRTMSSFTKEQAKLATVRRVTSILMVDSVEELPTGESALRMELCTQSLAALVERVGQLAASDVAVLGRAMASALAAAHSVGVVHGGVSPSNVLFRDTGEPVVADFGVTLRQAFARDPLHAIEYLPPETLRNGTLNELTDLYGLGAVLHFALTGRSPHPGRLGEQPGERVLRILGEPVPAINREDVPVGLSTLVARLLATTPERRPQDAAQVADHLTSMLPNPPAAPPTEDWDDFDSPVAVPAVPEDPLDFDDFAIRPNWSPWQPPPGHPSPWTRSPTPPASRTSPAPRPAATPPPRRPAPEPPVERRVPEPPVLPELAGPKPPAMQAMPLERPVPKPLAPPELAVPEPLAPKPGRRVPEPLVPAEQAALEPPAVHVERVPESAALPERLVPEPLAPPEPVVPESPAVQVALPELAVPESPATPAVPVERPVPEPPAVQAAPAERPLPEPSAPQEPAAPEPAAPTPSSRESAEPAALGSSVPEPAAPLTPGLAGLGPLAAPDVVVPGLVAPHPVSPGALDPFLPLEATPADALATAPVARQVLGGARHDHDFDDDFGTGRRATLLAGPLQPPDQPGRRLIRYDLLAGAALVLALLALVPLLLLRGDPDEMSSTPKLPAANGAGAGSGVTVELAEPTDLTDKVQLTWKATRDLDFAVVVAAEGESTKVLLAERNHTMTVDVDPDLKYCFMVQATDGDRVYESEPQPLRGASCRK